MGARVGLQLQNPTSVEPGGGKCLGSSLGPVEVTFLPCLLLVPRLESDAVTSRPSVVISDGLALSDPALLSDPGKTPSRKVPLRQPGLRVQALDLSNPAVVRAPTHTHTACHSQDLQKGKWQLPSDVLRGPSQQHRPEEDGALAWQS